MKISNETKVGTITAISIAILILGYNFLKGENLFTDYNKYYANYEEIDGLFKSNPVLINGYKVGQVSNVSMNPRTLKLLVEVKVPNNIKVPKNSVIKIVNTDMVGSKGVYIIMGDSKIIAKGNDTLDSDKDPGLAKTVSKLIAPLSDKINILINEINNQISGDQIKKTLQGLNKTLQTVDIAVENIDKMLKSKDSGLDKIVSDLGSVTGDLKSSTPKINGILTDIKQTTEELNRIKLEATINDLKTAITEITKTVENINKGQGSLGKLATNDELYIKLNSTIENFNKLATDIQKYPRRYTGVTERQRKKGDEQKKKSK
ncbi:MAG: MCE family protein [Bacteroidetes bacterium]|nr:MCE family protein [Bacteroidota bacterium]